MTDAHRPDERLARADNPMLTGVREVRLARRDCEALLLPGMDVFGNRAAGHAAPVESHDIFAGVIRGRGELDRFAGRRVGELPKLSEGDVWDGHAGTLSWACLDVPFRQRYHATVVAIAVASGVASLPNVDSYLVVSSTNGCSNSYDSSTSSRSVG